MQIASEKVYSKLKTFETLEQLNESVRQYKDLIADMKLRQDVKRNLLTVLEYIKRHSCKFFGVSWKGKRKIAADLGLSDKTITRICSRLESLGFIRQHEMKRASDMCQTSNAIVIVPPASPENVRQATEEVSDHENNISIKQLNNNKTLRTGKPSWIPDKVYSLISAHYSDVKIIEEYWRSVHATTYAYNFDAATKEQLAIESFYAMKTKRKTLRNPIGFFTGIVKRKAKTMHLTEMFNSVFESDYTTD